MEAGLRVVDDSGWTEVHCDTRVQEHAERETGTGAGTGTSSTGSDRQREVEVAAGTEQGVDDRAQRAPAATVARGRSTRHLCAQCVSGGAPPTMTAGGV